MITYTKHAMTRMNQRGITKEMINLTIEYGMCSNDKIILGTKIIKKLLNKVASDLKSKLLKILDKGGVTVVLGEDASVITVYNCNRLKLYI
jgi:hypothetical protein